MVGVAGKSKACNECKRRRVTCGFERPGCLRCVKAKLKCTGYSKAVVFINRTHDQLSKQACHLAIEDKGHRYAPAPKLRGIYDWELEELEVQVRRTEGTSPDYGSRIYKILQDLYLPKDGSDVTPCFSWVRSVCEIQGPCPVLDYALLAFTATQVYITGTGCVTREQSIQWYSCALQKLSLSLKKEKYDQMEHLIAGIVVLSVCELFTCTTDAGWRAHTHGVAELLQMQLRHPLSAPSTRTWETLVSRIRVMSVLSALTRRQRGILTIPQWWKLLPLRDDDEFHKLFDVASYLPALFEKADVLIYSNESSSAYRAAVVEALLSVVKGLYDWQRQWRCGRSTPFYHTAPSLLHNPADDKYGNKLFPFALHFESLGVSMLFILSWGMILQTLMSLMRLHKHFSDTPLESPTLAEISVLYLPPTENDAMDESKVWRSCPIREEADKLARYQCQCMEYLFRKESGTLGPQSSAYSRWVIRSYFEDIGAERELDWCHNIINMSGEESICGIVLMSFG